MSYREIGRLHDEWRDRHGVGWSKTGCGYTAREYAYVVVCHRLGRVSSLSYGYYVGGSSTDDKPNRKKIREQVDSIIAERKDPNA